MIRDLDELRYEGGYPTAESVRKLYDQLDLQRAAQAYLDFMPAMSMQALLDAHPREPGRGGARPLKRKGVRWSRSTR